MKSNTGVDELKLLGLLWRDSEVSPRSGLSTKTIASLAIQVADQEGLGAVTIRHLATEAGVTPMALYPHIGGRPELIELMLDHVAETVYEEAGALGHAEWPDRVKAIAEANWHSCLTHPWTTEIPAGRSVPGPGASRKYEIELQALDNIGLADIEMDHTLTALLALVHGTARASITTNAARSAENQSDTQWWAALENQMAAAMGDPAKFPTATRVSRTLGNATGKANDPEGAFRQGVDVFIDGLTFQLQQDHTT